MKQRSAFVWLFITLLFACYITPLEASTITHLTYASHGPEWLEFLKERAEAFKKLEPDINIDFMVAAGDYATRFMVMVAAGAPPDVTDFYPALAGDLITQDYFVDLAPLVRKATDMEPSRLFTPAALEAVSHNGLLWSLPIYINPRVTYYNNDLFSNMGLQNPSQLGDAWTWTTMRESARKITRDTNGDGTNDIFGIENLSYYLGWQQLIHQAGGQMYDRIVAPTASRFLTSAIETAVEFARQLMVEDGVVGGSFITGNVAICTINGPNILASLKTAPFSWDIELQAMGPYSRASAFGIGGFQIIKSSKEQEAAFKWIRFLTMEKESASSYVSSTGRIPPLRSVQPDFPRLVPDLPNNWSAFSRTVDAPNSFTLYVVTKNSTEITNIVYGTLAQVWNGKMPTRLALETIHEQVTALFKQ
jgi:multiple sugar transport system substrate-binding protein